MIRQEHLCELHRIYVRLGARCAYVNVWKSMKISRPGQAMKRFFGKRIGPAGD